MNPDNNVTKRKKGKQQLEELMGNFQSTLKQLTAEREQLEALFDSLPLQCWYKDNNNRTVKVNKAFADYMHLPKEAFEGKLFCDFFPPEISKKCLKEDREVIETGKSKKEIMDRHETVDGVKWFLTEKVPFKDRNANIIGTISFSLDITQRKKAEEEQKLSEEQLKVQERKLSLIYQHVSEVLFSISIEPNNVFRFITVNKPFLDATGLQENQVVGKTVNEVIPEPSLTLVLEKYNRAINEKEAQRWEEITIYPSGKKYGEVTVAPLFDSSGRCIYLIGNVHDITERKEMERQLKENERLVTIGAIAGMVGHDIRNPLQAIISDLFLLRLDLSAMPEGKIKEGITESLDSIDKNVMYINKIVQDLQDYAKPIIPERKQFDFQSIIQEVLIKKAIPENIDASFIIGAEAEKIITDPALLKRILANLVNNAVQAMPNGGNLLIQTRKKPDTIAISVEDTGMGIPDEIKPKLFKPLFTSKSKGQGFGLAVVKRLTEALDGAVSFDSEKGKGSKFVIELPIK